MITLEQRRARFADLRPRTPICVSDGLLRQRIARECSDIECIAAPASRSAAGAKGKAVSKHVPMFNRQVKS